MGSEQDPSAAAAEARARAEQAARDAKHSAEAAALLAKQAESYAREQAESARVAGLAGKKDSVPKGSLDLMPELRLKDSELTAKIRKGECDGCLSELLELALAHPRPHALPDESRDRGGPVEALRQRGAKEPARA